MKPSVRPEESLHEFDVGDSEITKRQILSIKILLKYLEETEELVKSSQNEVTVNVCGLHHRRQSVKMC